MYQFKDNESFLREYRPTYVMRVKDMSEANRPREKLSAAGPQNLNITELVSIVLGTGTKKEELMTLSARILKVYGEKVLINETNPARLSEITKIPLYKACQLIACFELGRRFYENRFGKAIYISTAKQAHDYLKDMTNLNKEQLRGLYLNSRYKVIHEEVISVGSLTTNIVHPREVFQPAIHYGAAAVIVAHNHPSGSLEATFADNEVTERLLISAQILGIDLLDHLIIAGGSYISIIESLA